MGVCSGKLTRAVVPCVAGCGGLHMSGLHPTRRAHAADARRRRVSHRAPALRPHRTDQISMRVQRARKSRGENSRPLRTPQIWVRGWPAPGFAVLQLVVVWQAKKAAAEKQAAEEAEKVPSSPGLDGCGLRRTASDTCSCVEWRHRFHSHTSALCRTPARAIARGRAFAAAMGATACAFALL